MAGPLLAKNFKSEGDVTRPQSQYNEPQLVKALEKHGIGRPSTFASIVDKLVTKTYVAKGVNPQSSHTVTHYARNADDPETISTETEVIHVGGKETDKMVPTSLGRRVNEYLTGITPYLLDTMFTSSMERDLDNVARGELEHKVMLSEFYAKFHGSVNHAMNEQKEAKQKPKTKEQSKAPAPGKSLRDFDELNTSIVQTRFGLALFNSPTNRFVSLGPFIEWRNIAVQDLTSKDIRFLLALPINQADGSQVAIGRYGLYIKDKAGKNQRLPRDHWDEYYNTFK
jgi:hypothetical protein